MDSFEISPLDVNIFDAQKIKGENLQCFLGKEASPEIYSKNDYSKKPNLYAPFPCLAQIFKQFLDDQSDTFKCYLVNGTCSRLHLKSKSEVVLQSNEIMNALEHTKSSSFYKSEMLNKLKTFVESE
jgi:hypothetical protein